MGHLSRDSYFSRAILRICAADSPFSSGLSCPPASHGTRPRPRAGRGLTGDSPKPGKWPSALCGASMTLASPSCDDQLPEGEAYTDSATLRGAILQGRVSCQSWVSSLAFRLCLTRRCSRPSCSGVLTPSCAPSYLTGLSAAARSDGCRPHHYRRANKAVAIHQSKKPTGESGFMCRRHVARESSLASLICLETCRSRFQRHCLGIC